MGESENVKEAFVCRGQCAAGACELDECIRTRMKRRRWDPPAPAVRQLAAPPGPDAKLGVAIDVGSTTLEMCLVDLESGEQIAEASVRNMQARYGSDVISRIEFVCTDADGIEKLHDVVRGQIEKLLDAALGCVKLDRSAVRRCVVTGNTTMLHLASGLSPAGMATYPFTPQTTFGHTVSPSLFGMPHGCRVFVSPCASAFIGADAVCGAMAVRSEGYSGSALLADLGTNGEIVAWNSGTFTAASTAAGPVFEGGAITCGMPAIPGAVRGVQLREGKMELETIDGAIPMGLCGSGIVDALAAALELGSVDSSGAIVPGEPYAVREDDGSMVFRLTDKVFLTQRDIRLIQAAKAAVCAGIWTVQDRLFGPSETPDSLLLAGGLGAAIRPSSAVRDGIVPPQPTATGVGNAALRGTVQILLDPALEEHARKLAAAVQPIDLAMDTGFQTRFIDEMDFPGRGEEI